jgi:hypothetical protein
MKRILLGVLGLMAGYGLYLLIFLFSSQTKMNQSEAGLFALVGGLILFFYGGKQSKKAVSDQPAEAAAPAAAPVVKKKISPLVWLATGLVLIVIVFVVILALLPKNAPLAPVKQPTAAALVPTSAPACQFKCEITTESYSFGLSCEDGGVSTNMNDSRSFEYGPDGSVSGITVQVNEVLTYQKSGRAYTVKGTIKVDNAAQTAAYDLTATGGMLGNQAQSCKSGDVGSAASGSNNTANAGGDAAPTLAPEPTRADLPVFNQKVTPTIHIPFCDSAIQAQNPGDTYLCFSSEPGDFIGKGKQELVLPTAGDFVVNRWYVNPGTMGKTDTDGGELGTSQDYSNSWRLNMISPGGVRLAPGVYPKAVRPIEIQGTSNLGPDIYGVEFTGYGAGCNELTGTLEILELVYGPDGKPAKFAANFEQFCDGSSNKVSGYFRYHSTIRP